MMQLILEKQLDQVPENPAKKRRIDDDCKICCSPKNGVFAFLPCFHAIACEECCVKITYATDLENVCPVCRKEVVKFEKIFLSQVRDFVYLLYYVPAVPTVPL